MNWETCEEGVWLREVEDGRIWLPNGLSHEAGYTIAAVMRRLRNRDNPPPVVIVYLATETGLPSHWDFVAEIVRARREGLEVNIHACYNAISAGLNILVAGSFRVAHDNTKFGFHGVGSPKASIVAMDEMRIQHYASCTTTDSAFWREKSKTGELFEFDAEEALELGVIDEI